MSTKKIGIASDHAGKELKELLKGFVQARGDEVIDYGVDVNTSQSVDYPDYAKALADDLSRGKIDMGIAVCGTGIGMCITANKFPGVRAALVWDEFTAKMSRLHNDANMICLGARTTNHNRAADFVQVWLDTKFEGGRHDMRVDKIRNIEKNNFKMR